MNDNPHPIDTPEHIATVALAAVNGDHDKARELMLDAMIVATRWHMLALANAE